MARSVVVIPFDNLTADSNQDYLAHGVSAILTTHLSSLDGLLVPPVDAWNLIDSETTATRLAQRLGVEWVLEGNFDLEGGKVKIEARLVAGDTGKPLPPIVVEGSSEHLIDLMRDLATAVVLELDVGLDRQSEQRMARSFTRSHKAMDYYLRGIDYLHDIAQPRGPQFAKELFQRSLQLDPRFALAQVGLSKALWRLDSFEEDPAKLEEALLAASRASDLVPGLRSAVVGKLRVYRRLSPNLSCSAVLDRDLPGQLNPDKILFELALNYMHIGALGPAEDCIRSAVDLNPHDWRNWNSLGDFLWRSGQLDESRLAFEQAVRVASQSTTTPGLNLAVVYLQMGEIEAAIEQFEEAGGPSNDPDLAFDLALAYQRSGRTSEAERYLRDSIALRPNQPRSHALLGDLLMATSQEQAARAEYLTALSLMDDEILAGLHDQGRSIARCLYAAKAGICEQAVSEATTLRRHSFQTPRQNYELAKVFAICRQKTLALAALEAAIAGGFPRELVEDDVLFNWSTFDADSQQLVDIEELDASPR